jgi:hypothetical protein
VTDVSAGKSSRAASVDPHEVTTVQSDAPHLVVAGRYRILDSGRRGGMGVLHRAHDPVLDRIVAIKRLPAERDAEPDARRRLLDEARAAARLHHPNIVTIHEFEESPEEVCIVMEFVDGVDLATVLKRYVPLTLDVRLDILAQICDGLAYAHSHGVVHRDIKPGNVLLCPDSSVRIVDFGLARLASGSKPVPEGIAGTPAYLSPEQVHDFKPGDARSDLFSFGVLLYEFLSGARPFQGESAPALFTAIANSPHTRLADLAPAVPADVSALADRLLAKRPDDRPPSADVVRDELRVLRAGRAATVSQPLGETIRDVMAELRKEAGSASAALRPGEDRGRVLTALPLLTAVIALLALAKAAWFNLRTWGGFLRDPWVAAALAIAVGALVAWDYLDDRRLDGRTVLRAVCGDGRSGRRAVGLGLAWACAALAVVGLLVVPPTASIAIARGPVDDGSLEKKYQLSEQDYVVQKDSYFLVTTRVGRFNADAAYELRVSLRRYGDVEYGTFFIDRRLPGATQPIGLVLDDAAGSGFFAVKGVKDDFVGTRHVRFTCTYWTHGHPPPSIEIEVALLAGGSVLARRVEAIATDAWIPKS